MSSLVARPLHSRTPVKAAHAQRAAPRKPVEAHQEAPAGLAVAKAVTGLPSARRAPTLLVVGGDASLGDQLASELPEFQVRLAAEPYLPFGIHWPEPWSVPFVAYAT